MTRKMIRNAELKDIDKKTLANTKVDKASQVNDHFDYSKVVVKKPWGYEYLIYENGLVSVWILYIKKGFQTSMHCHPNKKTSLIVLSGQAICSTLNEKITRSRGEGVLIDKGVFHSTESVSEDGIFLMEVETPINKRDLVRIKDKYGREGKGYETVKDMSFNLKNYNYINLIQPEVYYNVKKKFGKCSISLDKFKDDEDFKENFALDGWDAIVMLRGQILDNGKVVVDVGDTIDLKNLKSNKNLTINEEIEVLVVRQKDTKVKLSDYVVSFLQEKNMNKITLVPSSTNLHLLDSIGKNTDTIHIQTQTEQAATLAAEAYSKLTGNVGVCIVGSGYSGASSLVGVADSWADSNPLMIISGQCQSDQTMEDSGMRQLGVQEMDIVNVVKPITKYSVRVDDPKKVKYELEKAHHLATTGRPGPVWLDIPTDIQGMNIDEDDLVSFDPKELKDSVKKDIEKETLEVISLLNKAKRPVIIAGKGIRIGKAEEYFMKLIENLKIPVLTSKGGADLLPQEHPFYFGRHGAYGQRGANFIVQNSDMILSIGSRLSLPQIGRNYKAFAREAKKVVVDIDKKELEKKTIKPDIAINSCASDFVEEMLNFIDKYEKPDITSWVKRCKGWKEKYSSSLDSIKTNNNSVNPYSFIKVLSENLKEEDLITIDGGCPIIFAMQEFKFKKGQRLIAGTGLDNPGLALPGTIGICLGSLDNNIVAICEDSGFQRCIQELETIKNNNLPVKIFVLNNQGYSHIKKTQKEYFGGRYVASDKTDVKFNPDISKISSSYGIKTMKISSEKELEKGVKEVLKSNEPIVCELQMDREQSIVPRILFQVKKDGKWVSKPLEDMYPFLDRKEFKENMIIDALDED